MSATTRSRVSAPGKLFLAGEYVVLDGGTAVVTAVDRRASGSLVAGAQPASPLVAEAAALAAALLARRGISAPAGAPSIDSSPMTVGDRKLGLGSSAAAAAVAVGAVLAAAGIAPERELDLVFDLAAEAHRRAQGGRGSGGDVAAAVYGGLFAYRRPRGGGAAIERLAWPAGLELVIFSTGVATSTADHVRRVEELADRRPDDYAARMGDLRSAADQFRSALSEGAARRLLPAAAAAGEALAALGRDADLPIVTPPFVAAAQLARELRGASKPSGAGGGDVGVAFFVDEDAAARFREHAPHIGLEILKIAAAAPGLRRDP